MILYSSDFSRVYTIPEATPEHLKHCLLSKDAQITAVIESEVWVEVQYTLKNAEEYSTILSKQPVEFFRHPYKGNGRSQTIPHNLGVTPELVKINAQ